MQGEQYAVCATLPHLLASVSDYKTTDKDMSDVKEAQRRESLWCGMERSLFSKEKLPWSGCSSSRLDAAKLEMLQRVKEICDHQSAANLMVRDPTLTKVHNHTHPMVVKPQSRGVVYTGTTRHFKRLYQSILSLTFVSSLPVEIFTDMTKVSFCKGKLANAFPALNVTCRALPFLVNGFAAKFYAIKMSSFSDVLFIDADVILCRDPEEVLNSEEYKEFGSIQWPDLWGEQCRLQNNKAFGQTAFSTHVVFKAHVMGLEWRNQRNISQEAETSFSAIDLNRHLALVELSIFLMESSFFSELIYGDKDAMRYAHLMMDVPFFFVPQLPAISVELPSNRRDSLAHFFGNNTSPMLFHQLKTRNPESMRAVFRLRDELKDLPSLCVDSISEATHAKMDLSNSAYDPEQGVSLARRIYEKADEYWNATGIV